MNCGTTESILPARENTAEETAGAISTALDFLRRESDAIGLFDVSELIIAAREEADKHRPPKAEPATG